MASGSPFEQLLGSAFAQLPAAARALHGGRTERVWRGRCSIQRGCGRLSRLLGWLTRLPPAGEQVDVQVRIRPDGADGEFWERRFGSARMPSRLWPAGGLLRERLGLARFGFRLQAAPTGLDWQLQQVHALGLLPLPARWFAAVRAGCSTDARGCYTFLIQAALPLAGLLVRYEGWLEPAE